MPDIASGKPEDDKKNPEIEETRTSIDTLLELLRVKGKLELNSIAVELNIDPRIVENWAKVLENGDLVKISYKVGKMYLEPVNLLPEQQRDLKTRTDVTKFILQEDIAIEKISLEKFSKNIEELDKSIGNMSKVYKTKLPDIQKILADVDKAYAPIEIKKRTMDKMKDEANKDFEEINKMAEGMYKKLGSFSQKEVESNINENLGKLNGVLESINDAQKVMKYTETESNKFFKSIEEEINSRMKELRLEIASSRKNTNQALRTTAKQLSGLIKSMNDQVADARQLSKDIANSRKDFERARHDLDVLKSDFADRYARIKQEMDKDIKLVKVESERVYEAVKSIKESFGDLSKYDDEIRRWKNNMIDMTREVATTRTEIIKLSTQLNALDSNKEMSIQDRAKALGEMAKEGKKAKDKTGKIKKIIKETADEIKKRIEENK
jgi:chromosome segregation ATPase